MASASNRRESTARAGFPEENQLKKVGHGKMGRVLVIEDDARTADLIAEALEGVGHAVELVDDANAGEARAREDFHDLLIVDRMLPGCDGLDVVIRLRAAGNRTPVLFLSGLGSIEDKIEGLEGGGDDYLSKPYALAELLARAAVLMRRGDQTTTRLVCADLELDLLSRTARRGGRTIELLPREFQILELLMRHRSQVVTRAMLLEEVWNYHFNPQTNIVDVHISHLRKKIDCANSVPLLETVTGQGYRMHEAPAP